MELCGVGCSDDLHSASVTDFFEISESLRFFITRYSHSLTFVSRFQITKITLHPAM